MDPEEFLELNKNGNTRRNMNVALSSYNRVMKKLGEDLDEEFVPLETAPIAQLPYLPSTYKLQRGRTTQFTLPGLCALTSTHLQIFFLLESKILWILRTMCASVRLRRC